MVEDRYMVCDTKWCILYSFFSYVSNGYSHGYKKRSEFLYGLHFYQDKFDVNWVLQCTIQDPELSQILTF